MSHETTKPGTVVNYFQYPQIQGLAGSGMVTFQVLSPSVLHIGEKEIARV